MNDSIHGNFVFDTGAFGFILDSTLAKNKFPGTPFYDGFGNSNLISNFMRIKLGSIEFHPEYIEPINCRRWHGRFGDGMVGWDLFKNKAIKVDYDGKKIIVYDGNNFDPGPGFEKISLTLKDYKLLFDASIELKDGRKIDGLYVLDLGCGPTVVLVGEVSRKFNLEATLQDQLPFMTYNATLYNDTSSGAVFKPKNLTVGSIQMNNPLIDYLSNKRGPAGDSTGFIGLVGNKYFENFEMYIDLNEMFLYLKPIGKLLEDQKFEHIGFGTVDRSDIGRGRIVTNLFCNSEAAKFGIKHGDFITHINGRAVETFTLGERAFKDTKKQYDLTFKRKDSTFYYKAKFTVK